MYISRNKFICIFECQETMSPDKHAKKCNLKLVFGYFAGRRGAGCSLLGAGYNLWGAGHGFRGAGCEMLSLILELQTCQFGLCFAHFVPIH